MGCSACGGGSKRTGVEYLLRFKDGSPEEKVPDIATARKRIQEKGGGTFRPVAKSRTAS